MQARFVKFQWENTTRSIATFFFATNRPYYFTAGQYADIVVPHHPVDNQGTSRTMTFSSSPAEKLVAFTTRIHKQQSSYKQALLSLTTGAPVTLTDAMGDMVLPLDDSIPLVFVAGGIGIASYASMVKWLSEQQDKRDITLLYGVHNTSDILFQQEFDAYSQIGKVQKILFTTDQKTDQLDWNGTIKSSRLTSKDIAEVIQPTSQIYISGAESMVEQLRTELVQDFGIEQYRIAFDYFEGYSERQI